MQALTLHHYGFLTADTRAWLKENELLFGKPAQVFETIHISSQKVSITFVEQTAGAVLTELIEPHEENTILQKWITKGITIYHTGYWAPAGEFDSTLKALEEKGGHSLPPFHSEAFGNKRCVFIVTKALGMIELIER